MAFLLAISLVPQNAVADIRAAGQSAAGTMQGGAELSISADTKGFKVQRPIEVVVETRNVSNHAIYLDIPYLGNRYSFVVIDDATGQQLPEFRVPRCCLDVYSAGLMQIAPGQAWSYQFPLGAFVYIKHAGLYRVRARSTALKSALHVAIPLTSNELILRITNADVATSQRIYGRRQ
ncbi:MAG: hypothetical protein ABI282_01545 [Candidatus Baltobacteraceae bacterium]